MKTFKVWKQFMFSNRFLEEAKALKARWGKVNYMIQGAAPLLCSQRLTNEEGMKTYANWKKEHG